MPGQTWPSRSLFVYTFFSGTNFLVEFLVFINPYLVHKTYIISVVKTIRLYQYMVGSNFTRHGLPMYISKYLFFSIIKWTERGHYVRGLCPTGARFGAVLQILSWLVFKAAWNDNCFSGDLRIVYVLGYCVLGARRFGPWDSCPNTQIRLRVLISNGNKWVLIQFKFYSFQK